MKYSTIVILFFMLANSNVIAQFTSNSKKNKQGLNYNGKVVLKPKFDSIIFIDSSLVTAYKKKKAFYINQEGNKVYKGAIQDVEPFQGGTGVVRLKNNIYGLVDLRGDVFVTHIGAKPQRVGNLVYVKKSSGAGALYYNGKLINNKFQKLDEFGNWVRVVNTFYTTRTERKILRKKKVYRDKHQKVTLYNKFSGVKIINDLENIEYFSDLIYVKDKSKYVGAIYYLDGKVFKEEVNSYKRLSDDLFYVRAKNTTTLYLMKTKSEILKGDFQEISIYGDYLYCELTNEKEGDQLSIYNMNGELQNTNGGFVRELNDGRVLFNENDSLFIGEKDGKRLCANYYNIGSVFNGYRLVYNFYSYSYINDLTYKKIEAEFPLLNVKIRHRKKNILDAFAGMLTILPNMLSGKKHSNEPTKTTRPLERYGFSNGLAVVPVNYYKQTLDTIYTLGAYEVKYNYLQEDGTLLNSKKYDKCFSFKGDTTWVELAGKYTLINKEGERVTRLRYQNVRLLDNGYYVVSSNFEYGLVSPNFKQVVSCKYGEITFKDGQFLAKKSVFDEEYITLNVE